MGGFAVFFGRKMTIDNLIPLQTSCFNKKDFLLDVITSHTKYQLD